jgi:flagellar biosynthesis/type III secretory pathway protein FliH
VLTENVRAAVKLVVHSADVRIAVHPTQKQSLTEALPQLRMQWPNLTHVEVIEDAEIAPGGCRVFTAAGQIDADLDCQIDRVAADLLPNSHAS